MVWLGPHLVRGRMRNDHKQREPVRGENPRGTGYSAKSPTSSEHPDSDYGSEGQGFKSLQMPVIARRQGLPGAQPHTATRSVRWLPRWVCRISRFETALGGRFVVNSKDVANSVSSPVLWSMSRSYVLASMILAS